MVPLEPLSAAVIIVFIHFIGEELSDFIEKFHIELSSLGAGLLAGTFFLEALPQLRIGEEYLGTQIYLLFLLGFVSIHVFEDFTYQHADWDEIEMDKIYFEVGGLATYGIIIGFIVALFFETYGGIAYVILIPFYIRTFAVSVYAQDILRNINRVWKRVVQAVPILGTLVALFLIDSEIHLYILFSIFMGFFLYIVVRDMIPPGGRGKPSYFLTGSMITVLTYLLFRIP